MNHKALFFLALSLFSTGGLAMEQGHHEAERNWTYQTFFLCDDVIKIIIAYIPLKTLYKSELYLVNKQFKELAIPKALEKICNEKDGAIFSGKNNIYITEEARLDKRFWVFLKLLYEKKGDNLPQIAYAGSGLWRGGWKIPHGRSLAKFLQNVTHFDFRYTTISNSDLWNLPSTIIKLNLMGCKNIASQKDLVPSFIKFKKLKDLNLCKTNITDKDIAFLPRTLEILNVAGCENIEKPDFSHLEMLVLLDLCSIKIINKILATLPKSLQGVCFDCCEGLRTISAPGFSGLISLLIADLSHTNVTNEGLATLPITLEEIRLRTCYGDPGNRRRNCWPLERTVCGAYNLSHLKNLWKADFEGTRIEDRVLKTLPPSIEELNVSRCHHIDNPDLSHLKKLVIVSFALCPNISSAFIQRLPKSVQELNLRAEARFRTRRDNPVWSPNFSHLENLEKLILSWRFVDDESIATLPQSVEILFLTNCKNLKCPLFYDLPRLTEISLQETAVTNESIGSIVSPLLTWINARNCKNVTRQALRALHLLGVEIYGMRIRRCKSKK